MLSEVIVFFANMKEKKSNVCLNFLATGGLIIETVRTERKYYIGE